MDRPIYLGMPILDISKKVMYEYYYDYIKPKYQIRTKLCYMNTDSFLFHMKTEDVYKDFPDDVKGRFDT